MEYLKGFIDLFLHLDKHLNELVSQYGIWTYLILFLIIFAETGLVVTPFLPGDSLLFAAGALAATGALEVHTLAILLLIAAIIGDTVNFWIGYFFGHKIKFDNKNRILKKDYLDRTHAFYEKYGGKTIIFARFVPIVRTFAPFVAGLGSMNYTKFMFYNITGGVAWIVSFIYGGYFFGNIPFIKKNFTIVVFVIIFISILPGIIEYGKMKLEVRKK